MLKQANNVDPMQSFLPWKLSAILSSTEEVWKLITETQLFKSKWHGWFLSYLSKQCFANISCRQDSRDPFKYNQVSTTIKITNKLNREENFQGIFSDINEILCVDTPNEDNHHDSINNLINTQVHKVIVLDMANVERANEPIQTSLCFYTQVYELRLFICTSLSTNNFNGDVHSRHRINNASWWHQERKQTYLLNQCYLNVTLQINNTH